MKNLIALLTLSVSGLITLEIKAQVPAAEAARRTRSNAEIAAENLCRSAVGPTAYKACLKAQVHNILSKANPGS